jgi:hypothetical protein
LSLLGTDFQVFSFNPSPVAVPHDLSRLLPSGLNTKREIVGEVEEILFLEEGKHRFVRKFPGFAHSLVLKIRSFRHKPLD